MDRDVSIPPSPGNLYTTPFLAFVLKRSVPTGAIQAGNLRHFGIIRPVGVRTPKTHVCTATQVAQWLTRTVGARWGVEPWHVDPKAIDFFFQRCCELAGDAIPQSQRHVRDTPFDQLIWLSNYAWHGGRTVREVDAE